MPIVSSPEPARSWPSLAATPPTTSSGPASSCERTVDSPPPIYQPREGSVAWEVFSVLNPGDTMTIEEIREAIPTAVLGSVLQASMTAACRNGAAERLVDRDGFVKYRRRTPEEYASLFSKLEPAKSGDLGSVFFRTAENSSSPAESVNDADEASADPLPWAPHVTMNEIADALAVMVKDRLQAEVIPEPTDVFACALWSDGRLYLEVDGTTLMLSRARTETLMHYLDRMVP